MHFAEQLWVYRHAAAKTKSLQDVEHGYSLTQNMTYELHLQRWMLLGKELFCYISAHVVH